MVKFRFEDLEIWQEAIRLATMFFKITSDLEDQKLWRFADQLRGAGLSIPNNIAESTGTNKLGEGQQLLRTSKRECYEAANMMIIFYNENLIKYDQKVYLFECLDILSRRIQAYSNSLK